MLEVMVAILILSFGLLGVAGLQVISLRNAHSGTYRTVATQLAYEMGDSLRANRVAVTTGYYDNPVVGGSFTVNCLNTTGCNSQEMAEMDIYLWNQKLAIALPSGAGHVCRDSTPDDGTPAAPACDNDVAGPYAIKTWWDDSRSGAAGTRVITVFQP